MADQSDQPVDEYWTQAGPLVAEHRFPPYLLTLVDPRQGNRFFARFANHFDLNDIELSEYDLYDAMRLLGHPNSMYAWNAMIRHGGATVPNYGAILGLNSDHKEMYARVLRLVNPHVQLGMAGMIETHWDQVKSQVPAWRAEAGHAPTLLGPLGEEVLRTQAVQGGRGLLRLVRREIPRPLGVSVAGRLLPGRRGRRPLERDARRLPRQERG